MSLGFDDAIERNRRGPAQRPWRPRSRGCPAWRSQRRPERVHYLKDYLTKATTLSQIMQHTASSTSSS